MKVLARLEQRAPARARSLPDFLIIGAQKGGTTSLYRYLCAHPQVAPAAKKEIRFFDLNFRRGADWYRAHFPPRWRMRLDRLAQRRRIVTGEATPTYLFVQKAAERVHGLIPDVRLIALLRDPVARAYSHYHHVVRKGLESRSFADAVEAEIEGIDRGDRRAKHPYVARGLYLPQLERWWTRFPAEQLRIVAAEDLYSEADRVVREVCEFLAIRPPPPRGGERRAHNRHEYERADADTWERLTEYYRRANLALFERLGREFPWTV